MLTTFRLTGGWRHRAEPGLIVKSIVREGFVIAIAGTAVGVGVSVVSTGLVRGLLFGVDPHDPVVLIGIPIVLTTVAMSACFIPAWRAARIDPTIGLRVD